MSHLTAYEMELLESGLARLHNGRLIPIIRGGDPSTDAIFPDAPDDLTTLSVEELGDVISAYETAANDVLGRPQEFVNDERNADSLYSEIEAGVELLEAARAELAAREATPDPIDERFAGLASRLAANESDEPDPEPEPEPEPAGEPEPEPLAAEIEEPEPAAQPVTAAAPPAPVLRRAPARSDAARPRPQREQAVALVAAASGLGPELGTDVTMLEIAEMTARRHSHFAGQANGWEKHPVARADWSSLYPSDRRLGGHLGVEETTALIASAVDQSVITRNFQERVRKSLTADGGLCAPVTPYYQLQVISTATRPVRDALAAFNADRGGIRFARPAALSDALPSDAIGTITEAEDAAGGSSATKSCLVVDCPPFSEVDVDTIFHCLQFGNLGARTFPELVAQWQQLVLAAHARQAETGLLTGIDTQSTEVTAGTLGLGATASFLGQLLAAANGMRNRHRMASDAVLRVMLPAWSIDMLVSDVIRGQFQRFDTDRERLTALLRKFYLEPSFYLDGAAGRSQVFGAQSAGHLLGFPTDIVAYLYPEGSFLYLDGGTLELGLVRDSVLNAQNNFQLFGETFEQVAFVGVESIALVASVCDSGAVGEPVAVTCPIDNGIDIGS